MMNYLVSLYGSTPTDIRTPNDMTVQTTSPIGAVISFDVTAEDLVDGSAVVVRCDPRSGETFPIGPTIVTCTAQDSHDNTSLPESFNIMVTQVPVA
jgi:hypothetical protein